MKLEKRTFGTPCIYLFIYLFIYLLFLEAKEIGSTRYGQEVKQQRAMEEARGENKSDGILPLVTPS